jgi:hypothetical protein
MPFEICMDSMATCLRLQGIILSPLGSQKGQYQRIGWFEVQDQPPAACSSDTQSLSSDKLSQESLTEITELVPIESNEMSDESHSAGISEGMYGKVDEASQGQTLDDAKRSFVTAFDVAEALDIIHKEMETLPKLPEIKPLSNRPQPNTVKHSSTRGHPDQHDIYCNGVIDVTLGYRYNDQLDPQMYPNINSILFFVGMHFELVVCPNKELWERFYEESHGSGIFTIRVV